VGRCCSDILGIYAEGRCCHRSARLAQVALAGDGDAVGDAARKVQRVASILEP
jgi:hypothetical protein